MDFENLDWELEAKRVEYAFYVGEECEFQEGDRGRRVLCGFWDLAWVNITPDIWLNVVYDAESMEFTLETIKPHTSSYIHIFWDGREPTLHIWELDRNRFIYALHCLNLLTPEIEAAIGVTLSEHQKLEWTLDFEQRCAGDRRANHWRLKAKALEIKAAFEIEGYVEFKRQGAMREVLEARLPDNTQLRVEYFDRMKWFSLGKYGRVTTLGLDTRNEVIQEPVQFEFAPQLAKGLVGLVLFVPELERALKLELTDQQRIEWRRDYEARIKELE